MVWTTTDKSIIQKSILSDKIKRDIFQTVVVSLLLYRFTTMDVVETHAKKPDGNNTRMLRDILNKSWKQHPTK